MRIRNLICSAFAAVLAACGGDPGVKVDELFAAYDDPGLPGAAVLVIEDGQKALTKTYGVTDIATKEPVRSSSNFRLASVTKQFTATAILMLVDRGLLSLDDKQIVIAPKGRFLIRNICMVFDAYLGDSSGGRFSKVI